VTDLNVGFAIGKPLGCEGETHIVEYAAALVALGHSVVVAAPEGKVTPRLPRGLTLMTVPGDARSKKNPLPSTVLALRLARVLGKLAKEIDILHTPPFPEFGLHLAPLAKAPSVLHVVSLPVSSAAACRVGREVVRCQSRLYSRTVTIAGELSRSILGRDDGVVSIGVNVDRFRPGSNAALRERLGLAPGEPLGLYVGTLGRVRNLPVLLAAIAQAVATTGRGRFLFVGGAVASVGALAAHAARLGIADRVHFEGSVSFDLVPEYLKAADFGLAYVPEKPQFRNQPPLKTIEYLAAGLPVIATDTRGNRLFVTDGENGLVTRDNAAAVAGAISRLVTDAVLRSKLGEKARASALAFDYRLITEEQLLPVYRSAISAYRSRRAC
jgi:glycosyltransferase involved in cell wall biosynthesis